MRWWRYGSPDAPLADRSGPRPELRVPIATRFWSKVDLSNPDGCWLWAGSKRHTYGEVWRDGVRCYAHRVAYELVYGPLDDGEKVCHRCDTPLCVRPDHLFAGTQTDNMRDMAAKDRWGNQSGTASERERRRMRRQRRILDVPA